jgi:hypothetical protein
MLLPIVGFGSKKVLVIKKSWMNRILSTQPLNRGERFTQQSAHVYINGFALPDEFSDTNGTLSFYGAEYSLLPSTSPQACSRTVLSLGYVYQYASDSPRIR